MKHAAALLSCLMFTALVHADEAPRTPPDIKTLVGKVGAALVNQGKATEVKSLLVNGTLDIAAQGIKGKAMLKQKGEDLVIRVTLDGIGEIVQGMKGGVGYESSMLTGTRLLSADETKQMLATMSPTYHHGALAKLKDPVVTGPVTLDGAAVWHIAGKSEAGEAETYWIDTKTFLPTQVKMNLVSQMGKIDVVIKLSDYKDFEGNKLPMTMTETVGPLALDVKFTEVKLNPDLPDKEFDLPPDVKKLVEKGAPATQPASSTTAPAANR